MYPCHVFQAAAVRQASLAQRLMTGTAVGAALSCALALPAHAQSGTGSDVMEIPAISVEAEGEGGYKTDRSASKKFTAPLVDTPKTITVIPKEVIDERNATSLDEVLRTMPGITLGAGEGGVPSGDLPNIRGFASEGNIYVDGLRDTGSQTRDMFNLEQVEVVKGPGSAYSGRGSTGGSINLVTKKARADNFIESDISLGAPLSKRATLDGNYMWSDKAALRLNLLVEDSEVAGRDEVETSSLGFAPSMSLGLGEDTRATLGFYHLQTDDIPDYGHPYDTTTGNPADVDRDNFYGLVNRDFQETQVDAGTLELEHDLDDALTLRNITRYSWSENDYIVTNPDDSAGNVANGNVWRAVKSRNSDTTVITNQTDLSGEFDTWGVNHAFNAGVELSREESRNRGYSVDTGNRNCTVTGIGAPSGYNCTSLAAPDPNDPWAGSISPSAGSSETTVDTRSVYAFDTLELDPQWLVNLGIRFDDYTTEANSVGGRGGPFSGRNDSSFVNYQFGLVHKPLPDASVYAAYGTSSDPSGTTAGEGRDNLGASDVDLDPEESRSYELGTKWDVFERRMALTAAVFRTEKTNARVSDPAGGATEVLAGEQRVDGLELGMAGNVTERWRVFGGYTYMDGEIVDDGAGTDDGNEVPNVPKHSLSIWTTYDVVPDWTVGGGATYMSRRYGNTANTREVPPFWRFDAMVEYALAEGVDVRLNANNLLDETYYDKPYTTHFATVAPGRSVVLTTSFKY